MKLAVFDFDSTLMDGETIDIIAKELNMQEQMEAMTSQAMNGKVGFFESLTKRVSLLKGLPYEKAVQICQNLPLMNGAYEVVDGLKAKGYKVVCFSGGFRIGTIPATKKLGLDGDFANILHHKDGYLTGQIGGDMMFDFSKGDMLKRLQNILDVSQENTIVVGDGANDKSMFKYASLKVAFNAHDILKKEANIIIDEKNLALVLKHI